MQPRYIGICIMKHICINPFQTIGLYSLLSTIDCETWELLKGHDDSHHCEILQHVRKPEKSCHVFTVRSGNHHLALSRPSLGSFCKGLRGSPTSSPRSQIRWSTTAGCRRVSHDSWLFIRRTKWIYWLTRLVDWSTVCLRPASSEIVRMHRSRKLRKLSGSSFVSVLALSVWRCEDVKMWRWDGSGCSKLAGYGRYRLPSWSKTWRFAWSSTWRWRLRKAQKEMEERDTRIQLWWGTRSSTTSQRTSSWRYPKGSSSVLSICLQFGTQTAQC